MTVAFKLRGSTVPSGACDNEELWTPPDFLTLTAWGGAEFASPASVRMTAWQTHVEKH